jgi:hypothetical protein
MTPELSGFETITATDEDGRKQDIPVAHRGPLIVAAQVCAINDFMIGFPKNRSELDSTYDTLDEVGLKAAVAASIRLNASGDEKSGKELEIARSL